MAGHFSAGARAFVPGGPAGSFGGSGGNAFSSSAAEFVPGGGAGGNPGFSSGAAAFVPGQGNWGGWQQNGGQDWSGGGYWQQPGGYPAPAAACGGAGGQAQSGCLFNFDAYSSDDSSAASSPRGGAAPASAATAALGSSTAAPAEAATPEASAAAADGAASGESGDVAAETGASLRTAEVAESASLAPGAGVDASAGPALKPPASQNTSPALTTSGTPLQQPSRLSRAESGSDSEWSLLDGAAAGQRQRSSGGGEGGGGGGGGGGALGGASEDTVAEMSERLLKRWLQRYADDGDEASLGSQWAAWCHEDGPAEARAAEWLVRSGLDDCKLAGPIISALRQLSCAEGLNRDLVTKAFGEYSADDIEDLKLDNPKVSEFVAELRAWLAEPRDPAAEAAARERRPRPRPLSAEEAAATNGKPSVAPVEGIGGESGLYSFEVMMSIRKAMILAGTIEPEEGAPRWSTAATSGVCEKTPQWAQRMAAAATETASTPQRSTPSSTSSRRGGGGGFGEGEDWRSSGGRNLDRTKSGGSSNKQKEPPLESSSNSWAAQVKKMKEAKSKQGETSDEHFLREMRSILNKLTVEKFTELSDKIIELVAHSSQSSRGIPVLMQLVFEKATTQHHFISMYVNLCMKLHRWLTDGNHIAEMGAQCNFKRILLNQCQSSFEQYLEPPEGFEGLKGDELYEAQVKYKTKMLGNIKLVGELIRHGMLAPKIAIAVAGELARDDPIVLEERLETLAVFLETVGPVLDDRSWSHFGEFDDIFAEVQRYVEGGSVAARIRFLLRDTLDLRRGRWQVQKVKDMDKDKPMTIEQVHEKARQDQTPGGRSNRSGSFDSTPSFSRNKSGSDWSSSRRKSVQAGRPTSLGDLDALSGMGQSYVGASPASSSSKSVTSSAMSRNNAAAALAAICGTSKGGGSSTPAAKAASTPKASPSLGPQTAPRVEKLDPAERRRLFKREVAQMLRQMSSGGLDASAAARRLSSQGPLAESHVQDEVADMVARIADEPRQRRRQLFPLLPALVAEGVLAPRRAVTQAVEAFIRDSFANGLEPVDPPDLGDIVLRELLPALGLTKGDLKLPACLSELFGSD